MKKLLSLVVLLAAWAAHAQSTNLVVLSTRVGDERAPTLTWQSVSNAIYSIEYADVVVNSNTQWKLLYEDYPSHGTNTFWLDTGNYFSDPVALHPKNMPLRFYRVALTGTNDIPGPSVVITSVTNGFAATGDLTVTVIAATSQSFPSTKLYVDGQEMQSADSSTNYANSGTNYVADTYILNTCEWGNGPHMLFGTARCQSGLSGAHDIGNVLIGYGVSSYVPVTFSNLITRISFSEPFFAPEDGQTQQISAVFAANVDWILDIQDVNTNSVRTVTGSGTSMTFNWDGTGEGSTNLPVGTYTYLFSAATNGSSSFSMMTGNAESFSVESDFMESWVMYPSGDTVPFLLYPPGFDTNTITIFEESHSLMTALNKAMLVTPLASAVDSGGGQAAAALAAPAAQAARSPVRPPINPVKGRAGVYGIAYQTYSANGTGFTVQSPDNGLHINQRIQLEGHSGTQSTFTYPPLKPHKTEAKNFAEQMKKGNWSQGFAKVDDGLTISGLRGTGNIFNQVKLGLLMLHGTYGTSVDFNANQTKQIYFPITASHSAQYLRMNEMSLGSSATNGLKWMAISACNSLRSDNWTSMQSGGAVPYNGNLHLLLGTDTTIWTSAHMLETWGLYMTKGKTNGTPMKITDAWINAAKDAYAQTGFNYTNAMRFSYAGSSACLNDKLNSTTTPGGSWTYSSQQVWP